MSESWPEVMTVQKESKEITSTYKSKAMLSDLLEITKEMNDGKDCLTKKQSKKWRSISLTHRVFTQEKAWKKAYLKTLMSIIIYGLKFRTMPEFQFMTETMKFRYHFVLCRYNFGTFLDIKCID